MARKRVLFFYRGYSLLGTSKVTVNRRFLLSQWQQLGRLRWLFLVLISAICLTLIPAASALVPAQTGAINNFIPREKTYLNFSPEPLLGSQWLATISQDSLLQQGKTLYDSGKFAAAVQVLEQAVQTYPTQGDLVGLAITWGNLSLCKQQLGDWAGARQAIATSLKLLNARPGSSTPVLKSETYNQALAQILDIQGRLQLATGEAETAFDTWEAASKIYVQMSDRTGESRCRLNQAQALAASGFYRRALGVLTTLNQSLQTQPDSQLKAMELRSLGESLQRVGELEQSRQVLQQSLTMSQRLAATDANSSDISMTLLSLGNVARAQRDIPAALNFYNQVTQSAQSATTRLQAQLNRLSLLIASGQGSVAQSYWSQIPVQLDQLPLSRAAIYARINFTQSLLELTDQLRLSSLPPRAIADQLATAVQQARSLKDPRAESYALGSLGGLYERQQQWRESRELTQQALLLAQQINATDIAYRWQWQLGRLLRVQGDIKGAIASYDAAVNSLKILRNDLVTVNRDVQFNFRDSVEPLYRQSVELLLQAEPGQPSPQTLDRARQRMEALQLAELDNFFREACLNSQSVLLDQVVDQENPTAAIFYPIILERQLDVILKLPQQPLRHHRIAIARSDAERVLADLRQAFIQPDKTKLTRQLSAQVYDWLVRPVEATLAQSGVDTLVFVLDGDLRNIPMASLYDGQKYLVEKYAIALSPGLQLLAPRPLAIDQLNALTAGLSEPPQDYRGFAPLPEVKSELQLIQQAGVRTTQLLDQNFTSKTLEKEINSAAFNVVHLATHGQFSSQARSTFILAADGPINVSQLDGLLRNRSQRRASAIELLVLSACQTATGDNRAALGLAGVAVRAGARSTLASLWYIDDRFTSLFIGEFYRELASSKITKAEALRRAQVKLLKYPGYSRPGFWAPYVLVGNWL